MTGQTNERRICEALTTLLSCGVPKAFVLVEEPQTAKFVQFGKGCLGLDVPLIALTYEETQLAAKFFRDLGEEGPRPYHAPNPATGLVWHGFAYYHDFGHETCVATSAVMTFFREVYRLPPDVELSVHLMR